MTITTEVPSTIDAEKWSLIESIDLSNIEQKLCHPREYGWTPQKARERIRKYRKWLYLQFTEQNVVPSKEIDEIWHCHILDTRAYAHDCMRVFGRMIHHFPYLGIRGKADEENLARAFARSKEIFARVWQEHMLIFASEDSPVCASSCETAACASSCQSPAPCSSNCG